MTTRLQILAVAAAVLLLAAPLCAHQQGHAEAASPHGETNCPHDCPHHKAAATAEGAGGCPHQQAVTEALNQALTLLAQAEAQAAEPVKATIAQARQQLAAVQQQAAACREKCQAMAGHATGAAHGEAEHECPMHAASQAKVRAAATGGQAGTASEVTCPVCGMKVDPKTAAAKSTYEGKTYYFCSPDEKAKFDKDPQAYLTGEE